MFTLTHVTKPRAFSLSPLSLRVMLCGLTALLAPTASFAGQTYYVNNQSANTADDTSHGTSSSTPWKTVTYASQHISGGDTVLVSPGTYTLEHIVIGSSLSGTDGSPTTFRAATGTQPVITGKFFGDVFEVNNANYVTISGFNVQNLLDSAQTASGGGGAGIAVMLYSTNVTVSYNTVHDCGATGISFYPKCDYYVIDHNTVYNCAADCPDHTSGISILLPDFVAAGGTGVNGSGYNGLITNNQVHSNHESYTRTDGRFADKHSDGNGIIVDVSNKYNLTTNSFPAGYYGPKVLVKGNNVYANGGRGIHVFKNSDVTVTNNYCNSDLQDPQFANTADAEMEAGYAQNCVFKDNNVKANNYSNASTVPASLRGTPRIFYQFNTLIAGTVTATNNGPDVTF